ncbi:acetolactate synthase-1/2/3 large subunit [Sulfitobacter undariae]|uniref:Acetolactate synthase-1/2/3 large subunit n=1 Tax=Sulfitobacter undariae TaxID=1563671 RepID=A0A7W6E7V8_9RHOB|nr:thiamine pyrophosphate-binding protein [Sulfitobacter undariae]MBB3995081.1 acetolactate synthase-1/2/3 large subunit [Sulfitobacter undariae]
MPNSDTIRAADAIARRLYDAGCRHAFGMPGGEVLTLVDALEKAGIRFVLCKHENAAGFMAEAAWQQTGAPGIMVATIGPGILNGVNSIANALQDRVPLIVISGCVDMAEAETYTHQVLDQQAVLRPITKASFRLSADAAHVVADKAVAIALEGQPGPVHIDVPISIADARISPKAPPRRAPLAPTIPAGDAMNTARDWLEAAQRPVMIVGVDAMNTNAGPAVTAFAERFSIPVITTYKAKGLLDERHPLALGAAGLSPLADKSLLPFIDQSDLVICVGYDPIEMRTGWRDIWDPSSKRVIEITAAPNHHYMHQASLSIIADCPATLTALGAATARATTSWAQGQIADVKQALANAFPTDETWGPAAIIDTCRQTLPDDTIATADSGAHRILLSQMWTCTQPRGLLQSSALCTMGCALPLAMGTALCAPDRTVVSFSGDAGFLMVAGELTTAQELGLKPIFIVFVDASLALIELKQRQRQLRNAAVDIGEHDFAAMGRAFGGAGHTATTRAELATALQTARNADTFTVIACPIPRGSYDGRI